MSVQHAGCEALVPRSILAAIVTTAVGAAAMQTRRQISPSDRLMAASQNISWLLERDGRMSHCRSWGATLANPAPVCLVTLASGLRCHATS
ncbi:hypothetical protein IG631_14854 [Alternaria alternata]|nr:hypothetical protein IG631_14854 [Alternaria alternata]